MLFHQVTFRIKLVLRLPVGAVHLAEQHCPVHIRLADKFHVNNTASQSTKPRRDKHHVRSGIRFGISIHPVIKADGHFLVAVCFVRGCKVARPVKKYCLPVDPFCKDRVFRRGTRPHQKIAILFASAVFQVAVKPVIKYQTCFVFFLLRVSCCRVSKHAIHGGKAYQFLSVRDKVKPAPVLRFNQFHTVLFKLPIRRTIV